MKRYLDRFEDSPPEQSNFCLRLTVEYEAGKGKNIATCSENLTRNAQKML